VSSGAEHIDRPAASPPRRHESLDEQVRRRGLRPVTSLDDVARDDVFESDEELDAFLAWYRAERQATWRSGRWTTSSSTLMSLR
jgi:hypothetical protein